jgi:hypothetical protein
LQKLNEDAELKAVLNLCETSKEILLTALDFNVEATEPIQIDASKDLYQIQYNVNCTTNKNYDIFREHFSKTVIGISMSRNEIKEYQKLNKKVYSFILEGNSQIKSTDKKGNITIKESRTLDTISLRNVNSAIVFQNFFIRSNGYPLVFNIKNDIETIFINTCTSNCTDNRFKISEFIYSSDINTPDKWILNCIGIDPYNNNGISGSLSFPDFAFNGGGSGGKKIVKSSQVFYCFLREERMRKKYFAVPQDQKLFTTQTTLDSHPLMCNSIHWPTEYFDDYWVPNCFGVLKFDQNLYFKHFIKCNYTIEQLSKITFIKIEKL